MFRFIALLLLGAAWLPRVQALSFPVTGDDVIGMPLQLTTKAEDTFVQLGELYGLGFRELMTANPGVQPWVPGEGTQISLPLSFILPEEDGETIVLNLPEFRAYHFLPKEGVVRTYAVGIGREGWETPRTETKITTVAVNPTWTPPASIRAEHAAKGDPLPRVVPPGPDNPLGKYAVRLSLPSYLFHGTNKKLGIGMRVSHGCVRLYNGDIEELAKTVSPGTPVRIINERVKAGWLDDQLFLEVHPPLEEDVDGPSPDVKGIIARALEGKPETLVAIDWTKVDELLEQQNGIPGNITQL